MNTILKIKDLHLSFKNREETFPVLQGIDLEIKEGQILGIVGESGCGKSVTAHSIVRLLPENAQIEKGQILFKGQNILDLSPIELRKLRGRKIGMVFQDPFSSLNPLMTIGNQIAEIFLMDPRCTKKEAFWLTLKLLDDVGISEGALRFNQYPHELSGGLRQRAMIAIALAFSPALIIADEPTTALDVTIQAQLLELLKKLSIDNNRALLLITHDLRVVSSICDEVAVMYAGKIVEKGSAEEVLLNPKHPYTQMLLSSLPSLEHASSKKLSSIEGAPPAKWPRQNCCAFAPRCPYATDRCASNQNMPLYQENNHLTPCWLYKDYATTT